MSRRLRTFIALIVCMSFLVIGTMVANSAGAATQTLLCGATLLPNPFSPDGDGQNDTQGFKFCLQKSANVTVTVSNYKGIVKDMYGGPYRVNGVLYNKYLGEGDHTIGWTGTNNSGVVLPNGNYSYKIIAKNGTLVEALSGVTSVQAKSAVANVTTTTTLTTASSGAKNCDDFKTYDEAQAYFNSHDPANDPYNLDGDGDGEACEDLR